MSEIGASYSNMGDAIAQYERKRKILILGYAMFGLSMVFFMIPLITIIGAIIAVIIIIRQTKDLKAIYKDLFVKGALEKNFQNVFYDPTQGFTKENVAGYLLCDMGNRFYSEDYIRAVYEGVPFEMSDVTIQYHTSDGENSSTTTYFKGRMMVFNLQTNITELVRVYSEKFRYRAIRRKDAKNDLVELESIQFNDTFDVYTKRAHDAFYLLTPHFMERLQSLAYKYSSIGMSVIGNKIVFAFNEPNNDAFDAKNTIKKIDYPQEIAKIQADINDIKIIISTIRDIRPAAPL